MQNLCYKFFIKNDPKLIKTSEYKAAFKNIMQVHMTANEHNFHFKQKLQKQIYRYTKKKTDIDAEIESEYSQWSEVTPRDAELQKRLKEEAEKAKADQGNQNVYEQYLQFVQETMPKKETKWFVRPHHIQSVSKHHLSP